MNPSRSGWLSGGQLSCDPIPPLNDRPLRLVLLGPPGVGKGTQAKLLADRLRACHLSTGDLFRAAKCEGTASPAIKQAIASMQRGELISDEVVIAMVHERFSCLHCHGGFLLDGFPRTVHQAEALEGMLTDLNLKLDAVISFELPIEQIVARLSGRRTCESCQTVFHLSACPPKVFGVCDHCGNQLLQREDDHPDTIRVRMRAYEEQTRPLASFYEQLGILQRVDAGGSPEAVFDQTLEQLNHNSNAAA